VTPIRSLPLLAALLAATGCLDDASDPCDEYVAYMCDCHGDTEDCDQLASTYAGADQDLQDECAISLDDQQTEDEEIGHTCTSGGDTGE